MALAAQHLEVVQVLVLMAVMLVRAVVSLQAGLRAAAVAGGCLQAGVPTDDPPVRRPQECLVVEALQHRGVHGLEHVSQCFEALAGRATPRQEELFRRHGWYPSKRFSCGLAAASKLACFPTHDRFATPDPPVLFFKTYSLASCAVPVSSVVSRSRA